MHDHVKCVDIILPLPWPVTELGSNITLIHIPLFYFWTLCWWIL